MLLETDKTQLVGSIVLIAMNTENTIDSKKSQIMKFSINLLKNNIGYLQVMYIHSFYLIVRRGQRPAWKTKTTISIA